MTAPRYLTVKDVQSILQCGQTYAYELIERLGRARCPGIARVLESKFYEYLEGKDLPCDSTHAGSGTERRDSFESAKLTTGEFNEP